MEIKVRLFATLREGRGKELQLHLEAGTTVQMILNQLDIPMEDVAIMLVNGRDTHPANVLIHGDILSVFPPVGGG
jgi:molybdopterin converting factor small subunit